MTEPATGLLDRHLAFLHALRGAGVSVSLAEDLDSLAALSALPWDQRETIRTAYAATVLKRQGQRSTFDALFDVYFPRMVGDGVAGESSDEEDGNGPHDTGPALQDFLGVLAAGLEADSVDAQTLAELAAEAVARFGAMPGRGPGMSSWSSYTTMQRVAPAQLMQQIIEALMNAGMDEAAATRGAQQRLAAFAEAVEADARRRIAEERGAEHIAQVAVRPAIDRLDFTAARKSDLEEMRREIYPLARRLATRLAMEQHARRRGPLDFRRTVRASISTGGVPLTTYHKPKRPHRAELVILCDVSGSVANFANFTLMLVYALREHFTKVRAFTFIDHVHEVTDSFKPGADMVDVLADLAASTSHAALWGRTNYGRAFTKMGEKYPDALGPKSSLLILGDARSNYSDLALPALQRLTDASRHAWWLNPEATRHWGTGDSAAGPYSDIVPMVECRNLTQLSQFVHDKL